METAAPRSSGTVAALSHRLPGIPAAELLEVRARGSFPTDAYRRAVRASLSWAGDRAATAELFASYIEASRRLAASKPNRDLYGGRGMSTRDLAMLKSALDSIPGAKTNAPEIRVVSPRGASSAYNGLAPQVRLIARFLCATAARVTEALELRLTDLKHDGERVLLRFHGKGRKERWVRMG